MPTLVDDAQNTNFTTALGGAAPVANDTVLVRRWEHTYSAGADFGTIDLLKFHWRRESRVNFDDLKLRANQGGTGQCILEGGGQRIRLACDLAASVIAKLVIDPGRSDFQLNHSVGTITQTRLKNGIWNAADTLAVATVYQSGGRALMNESANAITLWQMEDGELTLKRDITTLTMNGGAAFIDHPNVTPTTVNMNNGELKVGAIGATIGTLNGSGGVADFRGVGADVTVGAGTLLPGFTLLLPKHVTVDISACTDLGAKLSYG